ncbi:MAG: sulfite exporter TauE/SafE family protein [Candidatus Omnitrophica bacterium]|nr:sulfite exporter TauE/SafE family protein [Candidatus Omnitrophota bacterium]
MEGLFESLRLYLESGNAAAYLIALAAGILTSFTPCVYPIIPITIGYIGANSAGNRLKGFVLSLSYVIGIAVTYSILGGAAALTGKIFGQASTSPITYLIIANVCIILGISMLGVFNLRLPSFLTNIRFGAQDKKGHGILPAFAIGLVSGLVMGPCTAPVLAVILTYVAARQNVIYGISILFTFALGLGFLLIVLGTFTGLLVSMPKAGPWLEKIKKGFGWILILVGEYFLFMAGRLSI